MALEAGVDTESFNSRGVVLRHGLAVRPDLAESVSPNDSVVEVSGESVSNFTDMEVSNKH